MADLTHISHGDARKYFQRELDEHGSIGKDQLKLSQLEDLTYEEDGELYETWALDIYDHELYECETALYSSEEEAKGDYEALLKLCNKTKVFKIPCSWEMYGHTEVRAETLEEAVAVAEREDTPLPPGTYIESSFRLDHDMIEDMKEEEESNV